MTELGQLYKCNVTLPKVTLNDPAFAVAPGQSAVFYIGDNLIGGGIIN